MNLVSAFEKSARNAPEKTAIFWGDAEHSYGQLLRQSRWLGAALQDKFKTAPGARIGVWLKNCPEFVAAMFGVLQAGAVVVPINNFLKPSEINYLLADAAIDVLITDRTMEEGAGHLRDARPGLNIFYVEDLPRAIPEASSEISSPLQAHTRRGEDLAVIIYTSGTTGHPKGAMLSHGNLLHNVESCRKMLQAVSHDRFVVLLPLFHSFMLCVGVALPLTVGGSMVLIKSVHPVKNVLQEIIARQGTILPAIPQFFRALAGAPIPAEMPLRLCISGAAPLPGEILKEFNAKFPIPLIEGYGLSEASPVVTLNPIHGPWKAGSIGVPIPDVEAVVQDDKGAELPPGGVGEICVRGGNVMLGYWNKPDETTKAFRNGWLLTGDIGYRDPDGYLYITDRKKDMLLVNGINVYPREIEEVLYQFPGVKEAAVIGRPDPRKGEQPLAFAVPNEGVELQEKALIEFLRERLADYKVPRRVVFLPSLPRNATGKILKTALRNLPADASGNLRA